LADNLSHEQRIAAMRGVKARDTSPEIAVRYLLRSAGVTGYRLHRNDLPGKPDIAFIGRKAAIFVHGCGMATIAGEDLESRKQTATTGHKRSNATGSVTLQTSPPFTRWGGKFSSFGNVKLATKKFFLAGCVSFSIRRRPANRSSEGAKKRGAAELAR